MEQTATGCSPKGTPQIFSLIFPWYSLFFANLHPWKNKMEPTQLKEKIIGWTNPFEKTWSSIWIISPKQGWTKMFETIALLSNCFQQHNTTFHPLKSNKIYCIPTNLPATCQRLKGLSFVFGIYKPLKQWRLRQMTICITYYITTGFRYLIWS